MPPSHDTALVLVDSANGIAVIPQLAELRRLNWFDGKLLRADDLRVEQDHMRALVRRSNATGGPGVVHGLGARLAPDGRLHVGPGVAVDPSGRTLVLHADVAFDVAELIAKTAGVDSAGAPPVEGMRAGAFHDRSAEPAPTPTPTTPAGGPWYVVTVGWAEGLCGDEEVHGNLCDCECTTSTDRSWRLDGLVFRACPFLPRHPLPTSTVVAIDGRHERSRLASALFADELEDAGSMIFGAGLRGGVWCAGAAADVAPRDEVPLAVISRSAAGTSFLDVWTACRHRIEPPPQRYWAGRMRMRPWDVFLAQVLQFQCQLDDMLDVTAPDRPPGFVDPCSRRQRVLEQAIAELGKRAPGADGKAADDAVLANLTEQMKALAVPSAGAGQRVLVDGGIVELPPAGYLPVDPAGPTAVQDQVRALLGEGVDLRFCTTRADALARELERAQHLDRISLLRGLDDPGRREKVQILVPDADVQSVRETGWHGYAQLGYDNTLVPNSGWDFTGAGRVETAGEIALRWAGSGGTRTLNLAGEGAAAAASQPAVATAAEAASGRRPDAWLEATVSRDPAGLLVGESVKIEVTGDMTVPAGKEPGIVRGTFRGEFTLASAAPVAGGLFLQGTVSGVATRRRFSVVAPGVPDSHVLEGVEAIIQSSMAPGGGTAMTLTLRPLAGVVVTASVSWRGASDSVELVLAVDRKPAVAARLSVPAPGSAPGVARSASAQELARVRLDAMPAAATPGHPDRVSSAQSLASLDGISGELGYAPARLRKLFPAQSPGTGLRATRDYVLFLRDAVLTCGSAAATSAAAPGTTRFAVYGHETRVGGASAPVLLGEIAFRQDTPEAVAGAPAIASAWTALAGGAGAEMQRVDVLSGAPGGDGLSKLRAERMAAALWGVTPRASSFVVGSQATLPVPRGGADGVMLVEARRTTVDVAVVVVLRRAPISRYLEILRSQNAAAALGWLLAEPSLPRQPFSVRFPVGSTQLLSGTADLQELVDAYRTTWGWPVAQVHVTSVAGNPAAESPAVRASRGASIAAALGASVAPELFERPENEFAGTRAAGLAQATLIVVVPEEATPPQVADTFEVWGAPGAMASPQLLGEVSFAQGAADVVGDAQPVVAGWDALIDDGELVSVTIHTDEPGDEAVAVKRADVVAEALSAVTPRAAAGVAIDSSPTRPVADSTAERIMLVRAARKPVEVPVKTVPVAIVCVGERVIPEYLLAMRPGKPQVRQGLELVMSELTDDKRGVVAFADASGALIDPTTLSLLVATFKAELGPDFETVHVISVTEDDAAGSVEVREERGATVADEVGPLSVPKPRLFQADETEFAAARAASVMETTIIAVVPRRVQ